LNADEVMMLELTNWLIWFQMYTCLSFLSLIFCSLLDEKQYWQKYKY